MKLKVTQHGAYTVYSSPDRMESDLLVRANACAGAEIIVLTSSFMDYGHFLKTFDITEDQYLRLQGCVRTTRQLEKWLAQVWPKEKI